MKTMKSVAVWLPLSILVMYVLDRGMAKHTISDASAFAVMVALAMVVMGRSRRKC